MVLGTAMQTYGQKLTDEQEVLSAAADILIDIYAAESAVLRAQRGGRAPAAATRRCTRRPRGRSSTTPRSASQAAATNALAAMAEGDTLRTLLAALRRVLKATPVNTVALRRTLADATVSRGGYILASDWLRQISAGPTRLRADCSQIVIADARARCAALLLRRRSAPDEIRELRQGHRRRARREGPRLRAPIPRRFPAAKRAGSSCR